ncbi:M23 family metallopeptidase [Corynebacterium timonense]|uniref:Peptidase family M23 n=1 Tax=Corynebacterium timonense TaxID=441500 RepID=A0A1H1R9A9_9CORY|nr:M23 family metallopeptidase [Corynebacterium timonense]SDS31469.1 Peptidase family M23 [Corynebacterium timonense]
MKRIFLSAATAIAVASTAIAPANALTINVGGEPVTSEQDLLQAVSSAVAAITVTGATLKAGDYEVVYDPRIIGEQLGITLPEDPGNPVRQQRGATADGRTVVLPASGRISSGFGPRWGAMHLGVDIANDFGTPIYAVMDGTVINAGPARGFGNWVVVEHDHGEVSVYGHMAEYSVSVGQRVAAGEQIATIGSEGQSTGPHLHFEIKPDGVNQVDPQVWLLEQGIDTYSR